MQKDKKRKLPVTGIVVVDNLFGVADYVFSIAEKDIKVFFIVSLCFSNTFLFYNQIRTEKIFDEKQKTYEAKEEHFLANCDSLLRTRNVLIDSLQTRMLRSEILGAQNLLDCIRENEKLGIELEKKLK